MKNLRKKLLLSALSMFLVIITLGTTTYAWFTYDTTANVSSIKGQVQTAVGLEVSKTTTGFSNSITFDTDASTLKHVSTSDGKTFTTINKDNPTEVAFISADQDDYIYKDIYVRGYSDFNTVTKLNVDISSFAIVSKTTEKPFEIDLGSAFYNSTETLVSKHNELKTLGGENTIEASHFAGTKMWNFNPINAIRMSIVPYELQSSNQLNGVFDETAFGVLSDATQKFEFSTKDNLGTAVPYSDSNIGVAQAYLEAKGYEFHTSQTKPLQSDINTPTITNLTLTGSETTFTTTNSDGKHILTLSNFVKGATSQNQNKYYYAKVRVYIWLEGWDADCINAILGSEAFTISFKLYADIDGSNT